MFGFCTVLATGCVFSVGFFYRLCSLGVFFALLAAASGAVADLFIL